MKARLPRIRRRAAPAPAQAPPAAPSAGVHPTAPTMVAYEGLPAGQDAAPVFKPSFRDRGRLRRRLRYLRRVRELGFRDLGGLVFDLHRFGRQNDGLVRGKLSALEAVDRELRALEHALDERREYIDLREPGIAACPRCGALHGSEARFCPSCGMRLSGPLAFAEVGEGAHAIPPAGAAPALPAAPAEATPPSEAPTTVAAPAGPPAADQATQAMDAVPEPPAEPAEDAQTAPQQP